MYYYKVNETTVENEDGSAYIFYGIDAVDRDGNIVESYTRVFLELSKAEELVNLCNECELSVIHLADVVRDALC